VIDDDQEECFHHPGVMLCVGLCSGGNLMSTFKLLGAVAVLSSLSATPVLAQAVIQEPGYCAFFYPNANCQNKGPGNPYSDPNFHRTQEARGWSSGETVGMAPKPTRAHRSGSHCRAHAQ
jgi:hypothetical protein